MRLLFPFHSKGGQCEVVVSAKFVHNNVFWLFLILQVVDTVAVTVLSGKACSIPCGFVFRTAKSDHTCS